MQYTISRNNFKNTLRPFQNNFAESSQCIRTESASTENRFMVYAGFYCTGFANKSVFNLFYIFIYATKASPLYVNDQTY